MPEQTKETQEHAEGSVKNPLDRLKEKLTAHTPGFSNVVQIRAVIGIIALAGMLLPWARLDGYKEAMSAADLIAYAFTSPERGAIFGVSKLGAIAILFTPSIVLVTGVYGFFRAITGRRSPAAHLIGAMAPLGMLMLSGSIVSSDGWTIAGIPIPGFGLILTILAQGILFIDDMMKGDN